MHHNGKGNTLKEAIKDAPRDNIEQELLCIYDTRAVLHPPLTEVDMKKKLYVSKSNFQGIM